MPYVGAETAKELSVWVFFTPFGLAIVAVTGYLALAYGRQVRASIKGSA